MNGDDLAVSSSFRYDQAAVLAQIITGFARKRGARSLLDIGAGRGTVAVPVARSLQHYVAIEQNPSHAETLRRAGLAVVAETFPVEIGQRFDMVVSSHSIPEGGMDLYPPFLARAWDHVAPGGLLLIITFKGPDDSAIACLAEELHRRRYETDHRYNAMLEILHTYGTVEITKRNSYVETEEFADVATFFGDWFWETSEQRARCEPAVRAAIDERFCDGATYRIPTQHLVIATTKSA